MSSKQQPIAIPEFVKQHWEKKRNDFLDRAPEPITIWLKERLAEDSGWQQIDRVWGCSEFVANSCIRSPQICQQLLTGDDLQKSFSREDFFDQLQQLTRDITTEQALMDALRQYRTRQMVRIVWRDFARRPSEPDHAVLEETTRDMTWMAEVLIQCALDFHYQQLAESWGYPENSRGVRQQFVVLGMGKLGAWELNVSSDIDLIFTYPESGNTVGGKKSCSNQEFFIRLGQRIIKSLDERTQLGFVFRVDMRLRPYGKSGPLAMNFDAMEEYFQTQGRDWERYAMVKARPVAGDLKAGEQLLAILRPFTYRKYIDFSAIESLREMKQMINREVLRTGTPEDVKKGEGGIREVEFIVQAFQLIRGGRDSQLQVTELKKVLPLLAEMQLLPEENSQALYRAYVFLRQVEHALQGWNDKQTQLLPGDEEGMQRVAFLMNFPSVEKFREALAQYRHQVRELFGDVVVERTEKHDSSIDREALHSAQDCWRYVKNASAILSSLGYDSVEELQKSLLDLQHSHAVIAMTKVARSRLDRFIPLLLLECATKDNAAETFLRALTLVHSVVRRSAYLVLLNENPQALQMLVRLCSASSWIAGQLARHPALLDELLDSRSLFDLPSRDVLLDELRQQLLRIPEEDLEGQMEAIRYFKLAHSLQIAACEVTGILPLMKVSDHLTWLAEVILEHVLAIAWSQMVGKYGEPGSADGKPFSEYAKPPGIAIIGYGKLGGIELAHGSDLDLVFIHNADNQRPTNGEKSVDNATFFARLGQRIIHILTARTQSGDVYEVDMRLRPSGNSGLLVTHLKAFEKYQIEDAWVWEHQALVRARAVVGDAEIVKAFNSIRERVLTKERDQQELIQSVQEMRNKMRTHLGSKQEGEFHLKQDRGGIVDIEFLVQYLVLRYAKDCPELITYTDNVRILETVKTHGLLNEASAQRLTEAYIYFRTIGHGLNLQGESSVIPIEQADPYRQEVINIWNQIFGNINS